MSLNYRFESAYVHSITVNSLSQLQLIDRSAQLNGQNGDQSEQVNEANYVIVHSWSQRPLTIRESGSQKMMHKQTEWPFELRETD